jgi:hypothetical protein
MRKEINNSRTTESTQSIPQLRIVENETNRVHVEIEIENHVKSIRALIRKLRPSERQKYFNGLLNHLLNKEVEYPISNLNSKLQDQETDDFQALSSEHLELIREMSCKLQDLYVRNGDVLE